MLLKKSLEVWRILTRTYSIEKVKNKLFEKTFLSSDCIPFASMEEGTTVFKRAIRHQHTLGCCTSILPRAQMLTKDN
jgi:hypothetical protein